MARKHGSAFHLDASRDNVIVKAEFYAKNPRAGMDLLELEKAIDALNAQPTVSKKGYRLTVAVGWRQQVQGIIFEEVTDVPKTA